MTRVHATLALTAALHCTTLFGSP
eukprot:COSAG03_NODE_19885_length_328_cov_0.820961_2_plen_23_part_01